jgi:tRNA pseudouridine13 synthase
VSPVDGRWPVAANRDRGRALLRERVEDFKVVEILEPGAEGDAGHVWMRLRKSSLSTPAAARRIADALRLSAADIGYSGLKDERSISEQWFSVPTAAFSAAAVQSIDGVSLLEYAMQARKLRRGVHQGNRFEILLREVERPHVPSDPFVFPNYFGQRRFGYDNIEQARDWLQNRRRRRITPFKRGIYLSVLRSLLFNEVLGRRVACGNWNEHLDGDVADAGGLPTGPLWGRGTSRTLGLARELEDQTLADFADVREGLEFAGVDQERRSLVGTASGVNVVQVVPGQLMISFFLPVGTYATVALDEYFRLCDYATS